MIQLSLKRSGSPVIVYLNLPASSSAIAEASSQLDQASGAGKTEIVQIKSVIANLPSYLSGLDPDSRTQLAQLNRLSSIIAQMDSREQNIYAGALDGSSINNLNDVIRVAEQVSDYILIPNVNSDVTLGRYVAVAGQMKGDPRFPEAAWPYLDFAKIGAEYQHERSEKMSNKTIAEFLEHHKQFSHFRPASPEEAGLFYSEPDQALDEALGTVGHLRMDFGSGGKGFFHTWWPHNEDQFNTGEFKEDLQEVVDALRADGPLKNLAAMSAYCHRNGGAITQDGRSYGYIAETKYYRYCLRCTPSPGDYQGYLYCYDLRQQQMARQNKPIGRVTFASGEQMEYLDGETYLTAIREELPYMATTGFRCETLTDDPAIRKAVDDILLDFAGEANPRRECSYGLTEKGMKALRDAADPSLPHSYSWFVITDCNTQEEQFHRDLTLSDAIRIYSSSDRPEKRIGVTKDGIATVDLVHAQDGEQRFFEDYQKMNSFQNDPEILAAVDCLRQELELPSQGMSMGGM